MSKADHIPAFLPFWPREFARQFYRWTAREPWWCDPIIYRYVPELADEPIPAISVMGWGRFFTWRWQYGGYGTSDYSARLIHGCIDSQLRERRLTQTIVKGRICCEDHLKHALAWAFEPFYTTLENNPLEPKELFHRSTQRKLKRLGLLDDMS